MILTNCNCGEKVACNCGTLRFDSYVSPSNSVLNVGNLVSSNGCVLQEYVIDWYRNGTHELVTGKGFDKDIKAHHPMTGTSALPVPGGTWVPVLRYFVVNNQVIYPQYKYCKKWCEVTVDFPTITVNAIYCGLVGTGVNAPASGYHFRISYNNTQNYSLAARLLHFILDSSAKYFVLSFTAYSVADRIKVYHSRQPEIPLTDFIVGNEATWGWDSMPYGQKITGALRIVLELPEFAAGDYLIIEVIPSVVSALITTDWLLDMRCLANTFADVDYNYYAGLPNPYLINSVQMVRDDANCRFRFSIEFENNFLAAPTSSNSLWYAGAGMSASSVTISGKKITANIGNTLSLPQINMGVSGAATKTAAAGNIAVSKSGSVYTIVCDEVSDFNAYKNGYDTLMGMSFKTTWDPDPEKKNHYRWIPSTMWISPVQCNQDGETSTILYFFIDWIFTFDAGTKTITIYTQELINQFPEGQLCADLKLSIQSIVNNINNTVNRIDFSFNTKCRWNLPFGIGVGTGNPTASPTSIFPQRNHAINSLRSLPSPENLAGKWNNMWSIGSGIQLGYYIMEYAFRIMITATRDPATFAWLKEPTENFRVYWTVNVNTGAYNGNSTSWLIYEIIDGVVTTSVPFATLYS